MTTTTHDRPFFSYLSLFSSVATLVCCALPLPSCAPRARCYGCVIPFGSAVAGRTLPAFLSRHKIWVLTRILIAGSFVCMYFLAPRLRAQGGTCPVDSPEVCDTASRLSHVLLWISAAIYLVGFFVAYLLGPILVWLNR